MVTILTFKKGIGQGLRTAWMLLKIVVPVYAVVTILGHTPVIGWLARLCEPIMAIAGLPGGAAIAFVTGSFVNIYAAIGIIAALNMNWYQVTTIAIMLNISHELLLETAILKKTGITVWPLVVLRLAGAFFAGALMNLMSGWFV